MMRAIAKDFCRLSNWRQRALLLSALASGCSYQMGYAAPSGWPQRPRTLHAPASPGPDDLTLNELGRFQIAECESIARAYTNRAQTRSNQQTGITIGGSILAVGALVTGGIAEGVGETSDARSPLQYTAIATGAIAAVATLFGTLWDTKIGHYSDAAEAVLQAVSDFREELRTYNVSTERHPEVLRDQICSLHELCSRRRVGLSPVGDPFGDGVDAGRGRILRAQLAADCQ